MSAVQVFIAVSLWILMSSVVFAQAPAGLSATPEVRVLPLELNRSPDLVKKGNRIKLVLLGDGFKAEEKEKFFAAANKMYKYLFSLPSKLTGQKDPDPKINNGTTPFNYYYDFFVVVAVFTPSEESGSCMKGTDPVCPKKTAFRTFFNCMNIDRLTCLDPAGQAAAQALFAKVVPDWNIANVIINDPRYGGSGGNPSTTSLDSNAHEVVAHELIGHNFAHLGDEYDEPPYPGFPDGEEFNTSKESDPTKVKWKDIIEHSKTRQRAARALHAPVAGARYDKKKFFRPSKNCKMKELGQEFCSVCQRGIIHAIHDRINSIESFTPAVKQIKVEKDKNEAMSIQLIDPEHAYFKIKWSLVATDGTETVLDESSTRLNQQPTLEFTTAMLNTKGFRKPGKVKIKVTVSDAMPLATMPKNPVAPALEDSHEWELEMK
ncbi:MAG: M64 family metallopeptidase [Bdellovibrionales bacterium]|nr:M64 family metallopeptidase [Bdellovibrionales bacterium]